jgi:hypothetical protein
LEPEIGVKTGIGQLIHWVEQNCTTIQAIGQPALNSPVPDRELSGQSASD